MTKVVPSQILGSFVVVNGKTKKNRERRRRHYMSFLVLSKNCPKQCPNVCG